MKIVSFWKLNNLVMLLKTASPIKFTVFLHVKLLETSC